MLNNLTIIGRLTQDIELEYVGTNNTARVNCSVAVQRTKEVTDFLPVTFLGKVAETLAQYGYKGMLIGITGSMQRDTWAGEDGETKSKTYMMANRCVFLSKKETPKEDATQDASKELNISEDELPF